MNRQKLPYDPALLAKRAESIITNVRELAQRGWTPATSSNFSQRLDHAHAAITVSGRDKGRLVEDDIMVVDFDGRAVGRPLRPSAETLLHTQLYRRFPEVGCVLHTHSLVQTVASRLFAGAGHVRLEGYELLKIFAGIQTHEAAVEVPVFDNDQDIARLSRVVEAHMATGRAAHAYLIRGHGLYAWGRTVDEARHRVEALEFLFECELQERLLSRSTGDRP